MKSMAYLLKAGNDRQTLPLQSARTARQKLPPWGES
jgi:hypothetical protein